MAYILIAAPLLFAVLAAALPSERARPWIVTAGGCAHLALTIVALGRGRFTAAEGWLALDQTGSLLLGLVSALFFLCALYAPGYLRQRSDRDNRVFCACLLALLALLTLIALSHHLGLLWVALEGATLTMAPMIYFNRNPRSLEATWKYLLIGSVGVALALLGSFFLGYSALVRGLPPSLLLSDLLRDAPALSRAWLRPAFVLLFVGYGTKMGLAPMHTWKPDAYGEAPGLAGALLAGGLTSCAFVAILRFYQVALAAGDGPFARRMMVVIGLSSVAVAAIFMARQKDYKRMLAYSSVEQMGILALGIGLGGAAVFGALLHMINNAVVKVVLFLAAGNIHRAYGSKSTERVGGAFRRVPASSALFFAGFLAVTGSPPFGPFVSELTIVRAAFSEGHAWIGGLFLLLVAIVFIGLSTTMIAVVQGPVREPFLHDGAAGDRDSRASWEPSSAGLFQESIGTVAPIAVAMAITLILGLYLPPPLERALREAAAALGGAHG